MSGFQLHDPLWLLALLPALLLPLWAARRKAAPAALFSNVAPLRPAPRTLRQRVARVLPALRALGLVLLVGAIARPQEGKEEFRVRAEGISIVMVIDRSGSMRAMDFTNAAGQPVDRLEAVKRVIHDFVSGGTRGTGVTGAALPGRPDDWIGLVAFGGFAESRCPLTLDHDVLLEVLDGVQLPGAGLDPRTLNQARDFLNEEGQTAIGDALALGVERVQDAKTKSRVVILLSDGAQTAGALSPEQGAALAKTAGVKVYSIAIGSNGWAPFKVTDTFGRTYLQRQPVELDESTLRLVAAATDGAYYNARDTDALEQVYREIDRLERTTSEGVAYTQYRELFELLLYPALALLLLDFLARRLLLRSLP